MTDHNLDYGDGVDKTAVCSAPCRQLKLQIQATRWVFSHPTESNYHPSLWRSNWSKSKFRLR